MNYILKKFDLEKFITSCNPSNSTLMQLSVEKGNSYVFIFFQVNQVVSILYKYLYVDVSGSRTKINAYYCIATDNTVKFTSNASTGFSWIYSKIN